MDRATSWFYSRQSEASTLCEEELAPGGALMQLGGQLGVTVGRDLSTEQAGRVGVAVHRSLGVVYGVLAARLVRAGMAKIQRHLMASTISPPRGACHRGDACPRRPRPRQPGPAPR